MILRWARERASLAPDELAKRINLGVKRIEEWETTGTLSFDHLERVAQKTYTPLGYFFLEAPPVRSLPIQDFRRIAGSPEAEPTPELLDTIRQCQLRQEWFREFLIAEGHEPHTWVGSANVGTDRISLAGSIRESLALDTRPLSATWAEAARNLYERAESLGVLVMRNGVVGNNTHRKLRVDEFRGFALADAFAPLIFVNASDSKAAQMFTLVHELCHLWLGQSAVSDSDPSTTVEIERFCNAVAAEALVPANRLTGLWSSTKPLLSQAVSLARTFKVSTLVVLIRAREAGLIADDAFADAYAVELKRIQTVDSASGSDGGDFYNTQNARLSSRFAAAVISSALEGKTPYSEAFRLLGFRKTSTFDEYAKVLGVLP